MYLSHSFFRELPFNKGVALSRRKNGNEGDMNDYWKNIKM
jgi:hypothetical protein